MLLLWEILHTLLLNGGILDSRLDGNVKGCLSERSFLGIGHTDRQTVPRALQSWCIMSYLKVWFGKYHPGEYDLHSNIIESLKYFTVNFLESSTPTLNHFKKKNLQFGYKTINQRSLLRKTTLCFLFRCIFWSWRILIPKSIALERYTSLELYDMILHHFMFIITLLSLSIMNVNTIGARLTSV